MRNDGKALTAMARVLLVLVAPVGCASPPPGAPLSSAAPAKARALLGESFADTPWPSDRFRRGGRLALPPLPLDGAPEALASLRAALEELDGFALSTGVFFPTDGVGLTEGPLEGSALLYDLDGGAPPIALDLVYRAATRQIVALPRLGEALREGRRYGCVLDRRWVLPSGALERALAGGGPLAPLYAPLVDRLAAEGRDVGGEVGAATVFTTGRPTRRLRALHQALLRRPPPTARVTDATSGAALDALLGRSASGRSGLGDPGGLQHEALGWVIRGTFDAPYFLDAPEDRLGRIGWDAGGRPRPRATVQIPFTLTLPRAPDATVDRLPVLIFQHGLNASMTQVLAVANDYARAGYATIGVDALWHGARRPGARDARHNLTGADGPDGFADESAIGGLMMFFDIAGDPAAGVAPLDGRYVRDSFNQAVVELAQLARLVRRGDLTAIRRLDPRLARLAFDPQSLVYSGESFGSLLGVQLLAVDPQLEAGVLAVGGAGIFSRIFAHSATFGEMVGLLLRASFDRRLDLSSGLPPTALQSLALLQAAIEPGDPVVFAPLLARANGGRGKHLLLLHADRDQAMPSQAGDALARAVGATVALVPGLTRPLRHASLPTAGLPIAGNRGGATVVALSFAPATHIMYTRFTDERRLDPAGPVERIDNPTELLHRLALGFARSYRADGIPVVR